MGTPLIVELIPDPELGGFTARIPDIPAYGEEKTDDEAIMDLKEALWACIEAFGIDDALARANVALTVRPLDWPLQDPPHPVARLPRPSGRQMVRFLESPGFTVVRVRGSHHVIARETKRTSIPVHGNRALKIGTLRGILRDFERLWDER